MSKGKDNVPQELKSQSVLRLPPEYALSVQRAVQSCDVSLKDRLTTELHADGSHGIVHVDWAPLALKTIDKKTFYKTGGICQMLVCTVDAKKKFIKSPNVEKEVKHLLRTDAEAVSVCWEVSAEDETTEIDNHGSLTSLFNSPGMLGHKQSHGSSEHNELQEIFNNSSSSSKNEDERDHHDNEVASAPEHISDCAAPPTSLHQSKSLTWIVSACHMYRRNAFLFTETHREIIRSKKEASNLKEQTDFLFNFFFTFFIWEKCFLQKAAAKQYVIDLRTISHSI
uniref:TAFII55 protein conserved region domain-containing protein n=1 Tax=Catharus ustulatus TaxID=91951 RepID=A0A8C3V8F8_CATUS